MAKCKVGHSSRVKLAVGVVRDLEKVLTKTSRKHTLTSEYRQRLRKCAAYLKRKRIEATIQEVVLQKYRWLKILRFLAKLVTARHIKEVFGKLMGE